MRPVPYSVMTVRATELQPLTDVVLDGHGLRMYRVMRRLHPNTGRVVIRTSATDQLDGWPTFIELPSDRQLRIAREEA
jgi:hypothetical protein